MKYKYQHVTIWLFCCLCFFSGATAQNRIFYPLVLNTEYYIDSLKSLGVDSMIGFGKFCSSCIYGTEEEFNIAFCKNGKFYLLTIFKRNSQGYQESTQSKRVTNSIIFEIIQNNKIKIFDYLNSDELIIVDSIITNDGYMIKLPASEGRNQFFYIKLGSVIIKKEYCCRLELNYYFWKRKYELWLLAAAFNNFKYNPCPIE